ncbi:MAG: ABC transporter ATP-binding protein [Candidatus Pacebacteria bacterium]|nr:ABC transporter ATP-binding protein [Candidatus Paceibacterota bacterium]
MTIQRYNSHRPQGESPVKENSLVYLFSRTWKYAESRKKIVLLWTMFITAECINTFLNPLVWAKMIKVLQHEGITDASLQTLKVLLAISLGLTLVFWSLHGPARVIERSSAFLVKSNYRKHLLKGILTLPMSWHVGHHSGDTIDKIEKGSQALYSFSGNTFQIIYAMVKLVVSYGVLIYLSPSAGYIVATMMVISMFITMGFDRILIGQYSQLSKAENRIAERVYDAISNVSTVIILRVERLVFHAIGKKIDEPFDLNRRNNKLSETKWFLTEVCCKLMVVIVLGAYFHKERGAAAGVLVATSYLLIKYLDEIGGLFSKFTGLYGDIIVQRARTMNAEVLTDDFISGSFSNHVLPLTWQELQIRNLRFSHNNGNREFKLDDINMSIRRGERIAFVGISGGGKTTLLQVIRDLYQPQTLDLSVDGIPIPHGFEGISRAIALVPQNPEIFATTILENITLGAEHDQAAIDRFVAMSCFDEVLAKLPNGYASSIKEKGVNLSGGQQQRLALARGLLACQDKDLILLDEPTSSLDPTTEMRVYQNIFASFTDQAVISSVHRLHLLPMFDTIYLFEEGRIVASGTLREILATCPSFQKLWENYRQE